MTGSVALVIAATVWGAAELARVFDVPERETKAVIAAAVSLTALAQIALGLTMTGVRRISTPAATLALRRAHRSLGTATLVGAGFVTYLCMTGPFPGGPTLHRVVGYLVCATVLIKIPVVTNAGERRALVAALGVLLGILLVAAFLTNGLDVVLDRS